MKCGMKAGAAGMFKIEAYDPKTGGRRLLVDWFTNLVTNNGLNLIGSSASYMNYCQVGTGASAPANTDTALQSYVAGTGTVLSNTTGNSGSSPYYNYRRKVFQFGIGDVAGNISEVGIGIQAATGGLFSRALVVDGGGSPTTVSVLVTEQLEVTYELRFYLSESDETGSISVASVSRSYTIRPANASDVLIGGPGYQAFLGDQMRVFPSTSTLGAITGEPTGTASSSPSGHSSDAYVSDSYERTITYSFPTTSGNVSGGVAAAVVNTSFGDYQISFNPVLEKDATKTMTLDFSISWDRYVAP